MTEFTIWHFDGETALRRHPEMRVEDDRFRLVEGDWQSGPFAFADLLFRDTQGDAVVYALAEDGGDRDGWRLALGGEIPAEILDKLPATEKYGGWVDRMGLWPAAVVFAMISGVVLYIGLRAPEWVAPLVPYSWEQDMGDAMVGDLGGRFCRTEDGSAALTKMVNALEDDASDLKVEVANIDMVNAAALPGGRIVLFNGLLDKAKSPDEVAGVLAHEIGHVRKRHVMQGLLRQLGLSVLLGGFDGNVGGSINGLLSMSYGRDAEREADQHSIAAMKAANVSPKPTAEFFANLAKMEGEKSGEGFLGYLSSHPMSADRRDAFKDSMVKGRKYVPILDKAEWQALRQMCEQDKDVEGDGELF